MVYLLDHPLDYPLGGPGAHQARDNRGPKAKDYGEGGAHGYNSTTVRLVGLIDGTIVRMCRRAFSAPPSVFQTRGERPKLYPCIEYDDM